MKYTIQFIVLVAMACIVGSSCVPQGEAEIPSYLLIDTVLLSTQAHQGTESARFPFVWLYVDNDFLGGYPVGHRIPILKDGKVEIELNPGMYTNGQVSRTDVYYAIKPYEEMVELQRGEVSHLTPTFNYEEELQFSLVDDFEAGTAFRFDIDNNKDTYMQRVSDAPFEGNYSGKLSVNPIDNVNAVTMVNSVVQFSKKGKAFMFIEMNYKCNTELLVGIMGVDDSGQKYNIQKIILKPRDTYRKIYLDITEDIVAARAASVAVYFLVQYNERYDNEDQAAYIDNVKVVNY